MSESNEIISALSAPFHPNLISWRIGATNAKKNNGKATKGIALAYIDARDVMKRLDEVVGPENWQCKHPHAHDKKTSCAIGIRINGEWIWKENGAGDTDEAAEKGAFSDSFKRAAVMWGIGRYLYDFPNIWIKVNEFKKIEDSEIPVLKNELVKFCKIHYPQFSADFREETIKTPPAATSAPQTQNNVTKPAAQTPATTQNALRFESKEEKMDWISRAGMQEIPALQNIEEIQKWEAENKWRLDACGPRQIKYLNDELTKRRRQTVQAPVGNQQSQNQQNGAKQNAA